MLISFKKRELAWIVARTLQTCEDLKHGLEDCYALLAPVDPGSTLVMSTPRNERVKGTITRVGTRIVKGVIATLLVNMRYRNSITDTQFALSSLSVSNFEPLRNRRSPSRKHSPSTSTHSTPSTRI